MPNLGRHKEDEIDGYFQNLRFVLRPGGHVLLAEFATLFAVGGVLTLARMRTGSLWAGIGLHAGWVFGLKWFSGLMSYQKGWLPWIGPNLKVGLVPLLVVILTGWLVLKIWRGEQDGTSRA